MNTKLVYQFIKHLGKFKKYAKSRDDKKCPECGTLTQGQGRYGSKMYWCDKCKVRWEREYVYVWKVVDERTQRERRIEKLKAELIKLKIQNTKEKKEGCGKK